MAPWSISWEKKKRNVSIETWREAPMHPSKLARIHTLQEKKREEKSTTMWRKSWSILVFPIMQATKRSTRLPVQKAKPSRWGNKPSKKKRWSVTDPALSCCHLIRARPTRDPSGLEYRFWMHRRWRLSFCSRRMEKSKSARWRGEGHIITGCGIRPKFLRRSAIKGIVPMELRFSYI